MRIKRRKPGDPVSTPLINAATETGDDTSRDRLRVVIETVTGGQPMSHAVDTKCAIIVFLSELGPQIPKRMAELTGDV